MRGIHSYGANAMGHLDTNCEVVMTANKPKTVGELAAMVNETRKAIKRGDELLEKIAQAGANVPKVWAEMAEATFKFRDRLRTELDELEEALEHALKHTK